MTLPTIGNLTRQKDVEDYVFKHKMHLPGDNLVHFIGASSAAYKSLTHENLCAQIPEIFSIF
ncbi:MAG: hypothetical protein CMK08_18380 [Ponticaulis sp.]|nr:hypothetical protein [Ponticaulis sp.]